MLKTNTQGPQSIEDRALEMAVRVVLDLNVGATAREAFEELQAVAGENPTWEDEADAPVMEKSVALHEGNPHYLLDCIDGYRAEFLDQFQQVRDQALSSALNALRAEGHVVVRFNPDELNGASAEEVEEHLVKEGNEIIALLAPAPDDDEPEEPDSGFSAGPGL